MSRFGKRICTGILAMCLLSVFCRAEPLEAQFKNPPASARPWVYWFPLNGNLTKDGITADFEAMARVGIGGVLYMEVNQGAPNGAADFAGPLWMDMFSHVCKEAKRLGLEINMNNDAGWNGSGGPWITPQLSMQRVVWTEQVVDITNSSSLVLLQPKAVNNYYEDIAVLAIPARMVDERISDIEGKSSSNKRMDLAPIAAEFKKASADAVVSKDEVIDLTAKMDSEGNLKWTPPAGKWVVMRFGHTTTGKQNHPAPASGVGLECDKLSKEAATFHFENLMGRIIEQNKALTGQDEALVAVHIDSWENGVQNWTPLMRKEFRKRCGYDILPFLPALTGRIIGSTEIVERFLWDLRQTISNMLIENYGGTFRDLAWKNNLRLSIEAYGTGPMDNMAFAGVCDEPMGEFWAWSKFGRAHSCTEMASAAHTYGKPIIGAEAFTSRNTEKWMGYPGNIKDLGDWAFCEGINRFVFHRYAAQPWLKAAPGMSMGPWGLHYERTQTWWEQSKAWHEYLARCQTLLRQGLFVADIAYLVPEGSPRTFLAPQEAIGANHIRTGYGFDGCSADVVMNRIKMKNGRLVLPDGMSYRILVLPLVETMTPELLKQIKKFADAGVMIVGGKKPPVKAPGLSDMGAGDKEVREMAAELWASGKILTGKTAQEFLAEKGVASDFEASAPMRWIHRHDGETDIYFVANPDPRSLDIVASFRVTGRQPELWWPDSGRMEDVVAFQERDGVTRVHLNLEPNGSVFVVFRKLSAGIDPVVAVKQNGELLWGVDGSKKLPVWNIKIMKAIYGVPGDAQRTRDVTSQVQAVVADGNVKFRVSDMAKGDDPAFGVVKTLEVELSCSGITRTISGTDPEMIDLTGVDYDYTAPVVEVYGDADGVVVEAGEAGTYELQMASGKTKSMKVSSLPESKEITGPWQVTFDPAKGGPGTVAFSALDDWSKRPEDGIKYYSGTAVYNTKFKVDGAWLITDGVFSLDLGDVKVMAEVKLNGKDLGILWKPPFRVDVADSLKAGENQLEIKVVNLWVNRQIGDEQLPEDSNRNGNGTLKSWPEWVQNEQPSPTGRYSFTSWRLWKKDDKLMSSGLLGPVRLMVGVKRTVRLGV